MADERDPPDSTELGFWSSQAADGGGGMPPEDQIHSFIVRIWLEEPAQASRHAVWRGHITHLPGSERVYVQSLAGLVHFIAPYLAAMGVAQDDLFSQ